MKPQLKMELSLAMLMALLSACSPMAAYAEVPPPTPAPTSAADVETVLNNGIEPQDVETVNVIDQLLEAYLNDEEIDISNLSEDEFVEFSAKLAEKKMQTEELILLSLITSIWILVILRLKNMMVIQT